MESMKEFQERKFYPDDAVYIPKDADYSGDYCGIDRYAGKVLHVEVADDTDSTLKLDEHCVWIPQKGIIKCPSAYMRPGDYAYISCNDSETDVKIYRIGTLELSRLNGNANFSMCGDWRKRFNDRLEYVNLKGSGTNWTVEAIIRPSCRCNNLPLWSDAKDVISLGYRSYVHDYVCTYRRGEGEFWEVIRSEETPEPEVKEMTVSEISKILGHEVKIIKE